MKWNNTGIDGAPVLLSYSVNEGQNWNDITSALTSNGGLFSAEWFPSATGNFLVRASWTGEYLPGSQETIEMLSVFPYQEQYNLTVGVSGSGSTSPSAGVHSYVEDSEVAVTASADSSWTFSHWILDSVNVGSTNPYTVTMDDDHSLTAVFEPEIPSSNWNLSLTATLDIYYDVSILGTNSSATDGFDVEFDQIDTIAPPTGIATYFYYPDKPISPVNLQKLSTSIIPPAQTMSWTYKISTIDVAGPITINWSLSEIDAIPVELGVFLVCPDDSILNMRTTNSYTFLGESNTTYTFMINVGGVNWNLILDPGWNMVSFPCLPADVRFSSIFADVPFYQVSTWDGSGYVTPTIAEAGAAYWVLVLEEVNVSITNAVPVTSYELELPAGWTMIGSVYNQTVEANEVFPSYYQLLTWNGTSYITSTTIEPGKGYWALVLETTTITIGDS